MDASFVKPGMEKNSKMSLVDEGYNSLQTVHEEDNTSASGVLRNPNLINAIKRDEFRDFSFTSIGNSTFASSTLANIDDSAGNFSKSYIRFYHSLPI